LGKGKAIRFDQTVRDRTFESRPKAEEVDGKRGGSKSRGNEVEGKKHDSVQSGHKCSKKRKTRYRKRQGNTTEGRGEAFAKEGGENVTRELGKSN